MSFNDDSDDDEFEARLELKLMIHSAIFLCDDNDEKQQITRYLLEQALLTLDEDDEPKDKKH